MSLLSSYKTLREYRKDPMGFLRKLHERQGHRMKLEIFGKRVFILSHPDDIVHVLKTNNGAYSKGRTTKELGKVLGKGLVTNEGESWRKQHRLIRPLMNLKSIFELAPKMLATTTDFVPELAAKSHINALMEMNRLTWRIILNSLFSQEVTTEMDDWLEDILRLMHIITAKTRTAVPLPDWVPTQNNRDMKRILKKFDGYVYRLINERRKGAPKSDLLQLLIDTSEEGTGMSDLEIRDEILTFMMAGHETITNTMSWTMIVLSSHPEVVASLRAEAANFFSDTNFETLYHSPWMSAVVDEVMRLWPPFWVFMRQAEVSDVISGLEVRKGENVVVAPFLTHTSLDFWENPMEFSPGRFLEKRKLPQGAYFPYGLGPRACIGAYFAGMEAKIILATMVHHFDWSIEGNEPQKHEAGISLRPSNNLRMELRRRP